jgi:hypothetical protein
MPTIIVSMMFSHENENGKIHLQNLVNDKNNLIYFLINISFTFPYPSQSSGIKRKRYAYYYCKHDVHKKMKTEKFTYKTSSMIKITLS